MSRSPYSLLQSQGVCRNRCKRTNIQKDASIQVTWHENHKKRGKSCWIQNVLSQLKNLTEMKAIHMFTNHLWFISLVSGNSSSENNRKYKMSYMHTDVLAALFFKRERGKLHKLNELRSVGSCGCTAQMKVLGSECRAVPGAIYRGSWDFPEG